MHEKELDRECIDALKGIGILGISGGMKGFFDRVSGFITVVLSALLISIVAEWVIEKMFAKYVSILLEKDK